MGCFDYRCAISGLPIKWHDPVRFMLMVKNPGPYVAMACDAAHDDSLWKPRCIPIKARYNDYGSVEGMKGLELDLMLEGLRRDIVPREQGENEYHDVPVSVDMPLEELLRALWETRVLVKLPDTVAVYCNTPHTSVNYAMIREDVWRGLLRLPSKNTFTDSALRVSDFKHEVLKLYIKEELDPKEAFMFEDLDLWDEYCKPLASIGIHDSGPVGIVGHWKMLRARKLPLAKVKSTLNSLAEFAHIHMLMKLAGHQWLPSTTYGQQWGDYKEHTRLFTAFAKVGAALAKKQREDD